MKNKNYHDINPLADENYHHSIGILNHRGYRIYMDIQCKKSGAAKVELIKAAIDEILKGKK